MPKLKDGWVSITYPGEKAKVVKQGSKAHLNAMHVASKGVRPQVRKVASKGVTLTAAEQKARGIPSGTKAQPKAEDKAQAKDGDK